MPILILALLALAVFGLIGSLLAIAMILEHSILKHATDIDASRPVTAGSTCVLYPNFNRPRGRDTPSGNPSAKKEQVHEHARTG